MEEFEMTQTELILFLETLAENVELECCEERGDTLNSSAGNEFDGEPDCFMAAHIKVEYLPEEGGEQDG